MKNKLTKVSLESFANPQEAFEDIAKVLLTSYVIRKGAIRYRLTDIEFYLYLDSHRDIITYPRTSSAGSWFFHPSGVDITFESHVTVPDGRKKPVLSADAFFGGILIRGIERTGDKRPFNGPMLSCDELFDQFDAFGDVRNFPMLVPCEPDGHVIRLEKRVGLNPDAEYKVNSILVGNYGYRKDEEPYVTREELFEAYDFFRKQPYHYMLQR